MPSWCLPPFPPRGPEAQRPRDGVRPSASPARLAPLPWPSHDRRNAMIYELRTYTLKQGSVPDVVKAASTVSRSIRGDEYGKIEGYWTTDMGQVKQVMQLLRYQE